MDLNLYFDPVSLDRSEYTLLNETYSFSRSIRINTPDTPIINLDEFHLAIMGVNEDRNAFIAGSKNAADKIRQQLYQLSGLNKKIKVIDLGNLKYTPNISDTYFAIRDIILELKQKNVVLIILGGSQDLAYGSSQVFNDDENFHTLATLDSRLDFGFGKEKLNSRNYLDHILKQKFASKLTIFNLGHQIYFTPTKQYDKFENAGHHSIRLATLRGNIPISEPLLRNSEQLIIDSSVVKQSDAPASSGASPNGLFGYELCQLCRYAGASDKLNLILFSELLPHKDIDQITAQLFAQAVWYFIDGYTIRRPENPQEKGSKKFIVSTSAADQNLIFYKSNQTDRWWLEVPVQDPQTKNNMLIACSYEDYQRACTNEIPDVWWRFMKRHS